ncbi:MAG: DUF3604 domain-containing protein [Planctomycetes bacterium]|nr:DUF3604 domain-containing protein [Planctomycetota bacterium]
MSQRAALLSLACVFALGVRSMAQENPYDSEVHIIKVVLHLVGEEPIKWEGSVDVKGGELLGLKGWCFDKKDKVEDGKWRCTVAEKLIKPPPKGKRQKRRFRNQLLDFAEPEKGLFITVRGPESAVVDLQTNKGEFSIPISDLAPGVDRKLADGLVTVSRGMPSVKVAGDPADEDYPRITTDAQGNLWVAWISWNQKDDEILARKFDGKAWSDPIQVSDGRGQAFDVQIACDERGKVWVVWVWFDFAKEQYDLFAGTVNGDKRPKIVRLTDDAAPDMQPSMVTGPDGTVWLAWQSIREGNSDIFLKRLKDGKWSDEIRVSDHPANDWQPEIAVDKAGTVFVAWDSYRNGNYDIVMKSYRSGKLSPPIPVTTSPDFEAHASIACDASGRVWVAWDHGTPNWGKDYSGHRASFKPPAGSAPMHAYSRMGMACVQDGKVFDVSATIPQPMTPITTEMVVYESLGPKRFYDMPHLAVDGQGRLWCFFRLNRQGYVGHPIGGGVWEIFGTYFADGKWSDPVPVANSEGRMNQRLDSFVDRGGRLLIAWGTGCHFKDVNYDVHIAAAPLLPKANTSAAVGAQTILPPPGKPDEKLRPHFMEVGGKKYQLTYGDLHRHTEISLCTPTIDGSLIDAYRYAIDCAQLDFLGITDHTRDTRPYAWWLTQKAADMFNMPGRFAAFYSYERSNNVVGGGHRNIIFTKRGNKVYRSGTDPWKLWKELADLSRDVITIPHTPGYSGKDDKGTWTYNDPRFEPLVEIFQAYRRSYEMGDPKRMKRAGIPKWSVWYALEKGYKIGFIASSDHWSTHLSYACVYAEAPTRQAIFDALRKRRTFGAMDNIVVEFSINGHPMGEEIRRTEAPTLDVNVQGTAPIKQIDIVRDNEFIHTVKPGANEAKFTFVDKNAPPGTSYYYVRLEQADGKWAWASPIWVRRGK